MHADSPLNGTVVTVDLKKKKWLIYSENGV